ncbi:MAG: DUF1232 domain-containing protein [Anaerolineales bacterium]|nr:DUF1232 domain-containing protein [Anaerolineales bacterium]
MSENDPLHQPPSAPPHDPSPVQPPARLPEPAGADLPEQLRVFTTPLTARGWPVWLVYLMAAVGLIYVLNPTLGIIELIPDNLPIIGNLDEGVAFMLIWFGLVEFFRGREKPE